MALLKSSVRQEVLAALHGNTGAATAALAQAQQPSPYEKSWWAVIYAAAVPEPRDSYLVHTPVFSDLLRGLARGPKAPAWGAG